MKNIILVIIVLVLGIMIGLTVGPKLSRITHIIHVHFGTASGQRSSKPAVDIKYDQNAPGDLIISNFQNANDVNKWDGVPTQQVAGKEINQPGSWLKVKYPKGDYPGLDAYRTTPKDWSQYQTLDLDIYNPSDSVIKFGIIIRDEIGGSYPQRYDGQFGLNPGMNNFELNFTGLKTNDKSRRIQLDQIKEVTLFLDNPQQETTLYLNNIRLERAQKTDIPHMYVFNFGPESSPTWPGATKVTNETKYSSKGYGWTDEGSLRAEDRQFPDPLFRAWVMGKEFRTDLPNGDYVVYMMLEDPGAWDYYQNYEERKVYANDKLVVDDYEYSAPFFKEHYLKHLETEDLPKEDVWNTYIKTRFVPKIFNVTVADGELNLRFDPVYGYANTLSCLIIYPVAQSKKAEQYIHDLNTKRKKYFTAQYAEKISPQAALDAQFTAQDYIIFNKNHLEPMVPNSVPTANDILKEINISAAQGESTSFDLDIYPLKDLGNSQVSLEDLTDSSGNKIPAENVTVRTTQYKLKLMGEKVYQMRGELLRNTDTWEIKKGTGRQFWVTVSVPESTPPGEYKGNVVFKVLNGSQRNVPIKLEVLPFKLDDPDVALGLFYFAPSYYKWFGDTEELYWRTIGLQLLDIKNHGLNTVAIDFAPTIKSLDESGKPVMDFEALDKFLAIYHNSGLNGPIVDYGAIDLIKSAERLSDKDDAKFAAILQDAYRQTKAHLLETRTPQIVFALADELSNTGGKGVDYGIRLGKIAKAVEGIRTTAFLNSPDNDRLFPELSISTINNGMKIDQDLLNNLKQSGSELWFYNIGMDRFTFGYYLWKTKAKGRLQWHYQLPSVDPYFDLDGRETDYCATYPSLEDKPINAVWFEQVAEGVEDYRYLLTLDHLINKVKALNNPAFETQLHAAQAVMDDIDSSINVKLDDNKWTADDYSQRRKHLAEQITILKRLLRPMGSQ
jgi:hypothetical protein